ncbi:MAG: hypothetical protein NTV39_02710 [Candidatus Saccharibacteria bacterium]|nr:hypothetical protein [Candidatus Saccharibacteria bacterium]
MIHQIALSTLFNVPFAACLGFLTLLSFAFTAFIGYTNYKNTKNHLPFKFHPTMVIVSFSIAIIHMFFAGSIFLGY